MEPQNIPFPGHADLQADLQTQAKPVFEEEAQLSLGTCVGSRAHSPGAYLFGLAPRIEHPRQPGGPASKLGISTRGGQLPSNWWFEGVPGLLPKGVQSPKSPIQSTKGIAEAGGSFLQDLFICCEEAKPVKLPLRGLRS